MTVAARTPRGRIHRPGVALVALLGLVVGHDLAFRLVAGPAAAARLLAATGHDAWPVSRLVATAGVVVVVVGVAGARRRVASPSLPVAYAHVAGRLALAQVVGFGVLELGERLGDGIAPLAALSDPVLLVGMAVQVAVGLVGGVLLVTADALVPTPVIGVASVVAAPAPLPAPSFRTTIHPRVSVTEAGPRAPPSLRVA